MQGNQKNFSKAHPSEAANESPVEQKAQFYPISVQELVPSEVAIVRCRQQCFRPSDRNSEDIRWKLKQIARP